MDYNKEKSSMSYLIQQLVKPESKPFLVTGEPTPILECLPKFLLSYKIF